MSRQSKGKAFDIKRFFAEKLKFSLKNLSKSVAVDSRYFGGFPVLRGSLGGNPTRFPISQILAELGDNYTLSEIAEDFDQDLDVLKAFINGLAAFFDRKWSEVETPKGKEKVMATAKEKKNIVEAGKKLAVRCADSKCRSRITYYRVVGGKTVEYFCGACGHEWSVSLDA